MKTTKRCNQSLWRRLIRILLCAKCGGRSKQLRRNGSSNGEKSTQFRKLDDNMFNDATL